MNSQIAKKTQSLTTAESMRNQTKLVMQPYANWEEYLTPAPLSISMLVELVFISSKTDFSVSKNPPEDGFKYIRYPDSFRACLMQVCNSGWGAFNEAHKNMDGIRLHTLAVPNYMMKVVKILFSSDDEVVQAYLPDELENIRVIADDCLELATSSEQRFTNVIHIVQELLEACTSAKHHYGEELDAVRKKLEEAKLRKKSSEESAKRSENAVKLMGKQIEEAHEYYSKAMDSIPSGWEMIGMNLAEGTAQALTTLLQGLSAVVPQMLQKHYSKKSGQLPSDPFRVEESSADCFDEINIYSKSAEILSCIESIQAFVKENTISWKDLYDQQHQATKTNFYEDQFKRIKLSLSERPQCPARSEALALCESAIGICDELAKYAPEGQCEEAKTGELIKRIRNLTEPARIFESKSKAVTKSPALSAKLPMMRKEDSADGIMKASETALQNARFKVEQSRAELQSAREAYEKSVENMEKNQKELTDVLVTMRSCKLEEIDFNTTIQMLVKGMDAMGKVKEQWEKMVHFFQMVSNIVKISLNMPLKDFISTSEKTAKLSYNAKLFAKDLLYMQAFQASNIASLVNMISTTYTELSTKHLMDQVSTLEDLMSMDTSKPEFMSKVEQLRSSCTGAQKAILALVLRNKEEFERKTLERQEKIDKELLAILPAATPEENRVIQKAIESGYKDEVQDDYI